MKSTVLSQVSEWVSQGEIGKSIVTLKSQLQNFGEKYSLLSNLGALYLQQGQLQNALDQFNKAVSLDPFSYIAYYNRFLCFYTNGQLLHAWTDLQKSLSCLYMQKGYKQQNLKYLNKSIVYCQKNAKAYLYRAKLNQGKNIKLIQNDYEAAVEYCPNFVEIYQQRALFYRKIKKMPQFQQNLKLYTSLKRLKKDHLHELGDNESANESQNLSYQQKIQQGVKQFLDLLNKNYYKPSKTSYNQSNLSKPSALHKPLDIQLQLGKLPLDSLQSRMQQTEKEDDNLLSSDRDYEPQSSKTLQIRKELVYFRKPSDDMLNKKYREIFQDQNSGDLNRQIDNIQREIMAHGGKLSLGQLSEELDVSDPSNFLTKQIEKTIEEIENFCQKQMLSDVKSVKSLRSNKSSDLNKNREISCDQFKKYSNIILQIIQLSDLQNYEKKQPAHIQISYNNSTYTTTIQRYVWDEELIIPIKGDITQLEIKAILKGGVFKSSSIIGEGTINLLEIRQTKCVLGNKERKTAILYFMIKFN